MRIWTVLAFPARMVQDRGKLVQRLDAGYFLKAPVWWDVDGMKNVHR